MRLGLLFCAAVVLSAQAPAGKAVTAVLEDWHLAAAQADELNRTQLFRPDFSIMQPAG